jgi:small subunit ribosomal protein S21
MAKTIENPLKVYVDEKTSVERSLKKFKRMCEAFGVVREYRKRQEYKKPSIRLKEKLSSAEKRRKKTQVKYTRGSRY